MRLVRYGAMGEEKPGLIDAQGQLRDLGGVVGDIGPRELAPDRLDALRALRHEALPAVPGTPRLGCPITGVGKFIGIGLNYRDHAIEAKLPVPTEPAVFFKATSSIQGPTDVIVLPRGSQKTDWEVELGVVIGTRAKYVSEREAMNHVAGYCAVNDVSERAFQFERGLTMDKGKCCDTFGPVGPWLVTRDEVADPGDLALWLDVNGRRMQDGHTRHMIFGVATIVSYLSEFMTLMPGDLIATGTPAGVGFGMRPPVYLRSGDVITMGIEGLGSQRQQVVADPAVA